MKKLSGLSLAWFLLLGGSFVLACSGVCMLAGSLYLWTGWSSTPTYEAQTACDHPYFPLRDGAQWRYTGELVVDQQDRIPVREIWQVDQVFGDQQQATAIVIINSEYDGGRHIVNETIEYACTPNGIFRQNSVIAASERTINQYSQRAGSYLPAPDQFSPGASWDNLYTIVVDYESPGAKYDWMYEAALVEAIDNSAGTFEAIRVEGAWSSTRPQEIHTTTEWFAHGVGQVQSKRVQTMRGLDAVSNLSLQSFDLP